MDAVESSMTRNKCFWVGRVTNKRGYRKSHHVDDPPIRRNRSRTVIFGKAVMFGLWLIVFMIVRKFTIDKQELTHMRWR